MRGQGLVLISILGILRHNSRLSQNVDGGGVQPPRWRISVADNTHEENGDLAEDSGNTVAWFITGAIIGATVAVLFAPKSGRETRRLIADTAQRGKDAVADSAQDIADASRDMFERGRKLVEDAADLFDRGRKLVRG